MTSDLQKWEYRIDTMAALVTVHDLNSRGDNGWELVQLMPALLGSEQAKAIFKRPLLEQRVLNEE